MSGISTDHHQLINGEKKINNHEMLEFIDDVEEILLSDLDVKLQEGVVTLDQYKTIINQLVLKLAIKSNDRTEI